MQASGKRIVIIGATSAIAEHCARLWVSNESFELVLVGRDIKRIERVAADLRVRSPSSEIRCLDVDFTSPVAIRRAVDEIAAQSILHTVLIAHGSLPDQSACQSDLSANQEALSINGVSPVLFAEAFAEHMKTTNSGTLVIISSVAGDRGRKSNYVYGAAKAMVTRYAQGLQHRLAATGVKVVLVKPGPTDTPMTARMKQQGTSLASVDAVARDIVEGAANGSSVIYTPGRWVLIMMIIRHLPRFVFNRMDI
jgi:short-subunit dehydrogenase